MKNSLEKAYWCPSVRLSIVKTIPDLLNKILLAISKCKND
jgi:hypothetical protein